LPAQGTCGGVILTCSGDRFTLLQTDIRQFSITAKIQSRADSEVWTLTIIYGPQGDSVKILFLEELRQTKQMVEPKWLVMGDFNLIYRSCDKSNGRVSRQLMNSFRSILDELEVKEVHVHGRRYTWSSGTANPAQTKIDHVFMTQDWELANPSYHMQVLGSSISDHCPMLLSCNPFHRQYRGFWFEAWWLQKVEFREVVVQFWSQPIRSQNKSRILHIKMSRLAKWLKQWNR
jgi:hypothetical protein